MCEKGDYLASLASHCLANRASKRIPICICGCASYMYTWLRLHRARKRVLSFAHNEFLPLLASGYNISLLCWPGFSYIAKISGFHTANRSKASVILDLVHGTYICTIMAEPFSVAVGILSIIKAAKTVYVISKSVKNAQKELEPLLKELAVVEKVVERIRERCYDTSATNSSARSTTLNEFPSELTPMLQKAKKKIEEVNEFVEYKLINDRSITESQPGEPATEKKIKRGSLAIRLRTVQGLKKELNEVKRELEEAVTVLDSYVRSLPKTIKYHLIDIAQVRLAEYSASCCNFRQACRADSGCDRGSESAVLGRALRVLKESL
jgi:hypothetical protein